MSFWLEVHDEESIMITPSKVLVFSFLACFSAAGVGQECNGGFETAPAGQFVVDDNNTSVVVHSTTGLTWARCLVGQNWNSTSNTCDGEAVRLDWQNALKVSKDFNLTQRTDWRLPNIKELASIVERQCVSPAANLSVFPNTPVDSFWSSTPNTASDKSDEAWAVAFYNGRLDSKDKSQDFYVRMVRYAE